MGDVPPHLPQPHAAIDDEAPAQLDRVHDGGIALDVSFRFQPVQAVEHRGRGEMDLQRQVLDGDAAVLLERPENRNVGFVESFGHKTAVIFCKNSNYQRKTAK